MSEIIRVAGYDRVSTPEQADPNKTSLEDQRETIKRFVEGRDNHELIGFYEDGGVSGSTTDRPALQRMIVDARAGKFDKVCFKCMTRFGRSTLDTLQLFDLFEEELNIDLISCDEFFDTSTGVGKLIRDVLAAVAQFELTTIKERMVGGRKRKRDKNLYAGGGVLYGSEWIPSNKKGEDGKIVPVPEERKMMYYWEEQLVVFNASLISIATQLNNDNVPTPSGRGRWWDVSISRIIHNDGLFGDFICNKVQWENKDGKQKRIEDRPEEEWQRITNPDPAFTKERVMKMREVIAGHIRGNSKPKKKDGSEDTHLLLDILECGLCHNNAHKGWSGYTSIKRGGKVPYYPCYTQRNGKVKREMAGLEKCDIPWGDADKIDRYVFWWVVNKIIDTDEQTINDLLDTGGNKATKKALQKRNKELKQQTTTTERKYTNVVTAIENETITEERAKGRIQQLEKQLDDIDRELISNNKKLQDLKKLQDNKTEYKKKWMEAVFNRADLKDKLNSLSFEQKRILLKNLFEDGRLRKHPIKLDEIPNIPPDENMEDYGIFFGEKNKKVGVEIEIELELSPYKILNILELLQNENIHNNSNTFNCS